MPCRPVVIHHLAAGHKTPPYGSWFLWRRRSALAQS